MPIYASYTTELTAKIHATGHSGGVWVSKTASEQQEDELRLIFQVVLVAALNTVECLLSF